MHELAVRTVEVFKALGDPARLKDQSPAGHRYHRPDLRRTTSAKMLQMTQPASSQHIKVLKTVGI